VSNQVLPVQGRPLRPNAVLVVVCLALLVVVVDVTVLHVAAPTIAEALGPSATELLWVVDIYPLVVAPLLLVSGVAGDRFGRRRLLLIGLVVFGAVSIVAAFAPSAAVLIGARALMGVGAAMILPSTMSLLRAAFPDRRARLRAVGIWSAVSAAGAAAGPLVGGILVQQFWWGAVFLINVPFAALVIVLTWRLIPESRSAEKTPIDVTSVLLSIVAVLSLVFAVKHAAGYGMDPSTIVSGVLAVVGFAWFIRRQIAALRRGVQPMLDVRLFTKAAFTLAVLAVLLAMFGIVGLDLLFAQYLQDVLGLSPIDAALRLMPMAAATIGGSLCAPAITRTAGTRVTISLGLGAAALALVPLLSLGTSEQIVLFSISLAVVGFALDVAMVAANDAIIGAVPLDRVGQAAGIEETAYDLGGGLGIAILGSVLTATYVASLPALDGLTADQQRSVRESISSAEHIAAALPGRAQEILAAADQAFINGLHAALWVSIVVIAATAAAAALLIRDTAIVADRDH
jgi:DHA2 family multidrug resistance protein-like MFS transporter